MLSKKDITMVEKVLSMTPEELSKFMSELKSGALRYLENIIDQYEKTLS